jgi:RNA polymerase sigma factor for flagellar operon FliA
LKNQGYEEQGSDINRVVIKHQGLVRRIAFKMHSRVATFIELDDLLQSGLEGLVDAAQKYSAVEGASFESYASIRIKGSMLDLIRRSGNLNRSTVQAKQMIDGKKSELTSELGRNPTDGEVAKSLSLSMDEYYSWVRLFEANVSESLSQSYDEYSMVFAAPSIEAERLIDSKNLRGSLVTALKTLNTQQSQVLQLYYVEELNIYEIAQVLDITPGRISQIKSEAFKLLKKELVSFEDELQN